LVIDGLKHNYFNCLGYFDHGFLSGTKNHSDELTYMLITFYNNLLIVNVQWDFVNKELRIYSDNPGSKLILVPYFDPEPYINNYDKLINKIKLYIVFS
jgi:hypothetical protein